MSASGPLYRVSFICTANRARSPFAAAVLARQQAAIELVVDSFGTMEREGDAALPQSVRTARAFGIDLMSHRARSASAGRLAESDLVLGFEPFHVAHAVVTAGAERSRVFLLSELAELVCELGAPPPLDAGDVDLVLRQANATRPGAGSKPTPIGDPVGGSDGRFAETYQSIERMVVILAVKLFGASEPEASSRAP